MEESRLRRTIGVCRRAQQICLLQNSRPPAQPQRTVLHVQVVLARFLLDAQNFVPTLARIVPSGWPLGSLTDIATRLFVSSVVVSFIRVGLQKLLRGDFRIVSEAVAAD